MSVDQQPLNLQPLIEALADAAADRVESILRDRVEERSTPWMNTKEAIEYTRLPAGTFRQLVAQGRIPHHGGRSHVFHRAELDQALGYVRSTPGASLRRVS